MTLREIKVQSLYLMGVGDRSISDNKLSELAIDPNYADYFTHMMGAINRALSDIEQRRLLFTTKKVTVTGNVMYDDDETVITLGDITGLMDIDSIRDNMGAPMEYTRFGDIVAFPADGEYYIVYPVSVTRMTDTMALTTVPTYANGTAIPEAICELIPYFVKCDLFREDEPEEATAARNFYEAGMAMIQPTGKTDTQTRIVNIYEGCI